MRPSGAIVDVAGVLVGHHHRIGEGWATGVTAVLAPPGTVGGVDVRGGGPGTRETDLLDPANLVEHVDAVLLCGGSAYGLAAADGALRWLAERGRGLRVPLPRRQLTGGGHVPDGEVVVPIAPAAVLFDLAVTGPGLVPDAAFGAAACAAAAGSATAVAVGSATVATAAVGSATVAAVGSAGAAAVAEGSVGAGAGARAGRLKGGIGTASVPLEGGHTVGALVAANPAGEVIDPATGLPWFAGDLGLRAPHPAEVAAAAAAPSPAGPLNTTIGVVATDATLTKAQCKRLAMVAHDGLARAVRPAHSLFDGDTVFALATGRAAGAGPVGPVVFNALCAAAADAFATATVRAVLTATAVAGIPAHRDRYPSAY